LISAFIYACVRMHVHECMHMNMHALDSPQRASRSIPCSVPQPAAGCNAQGVRGLVHRPVLPSVVPYVSMFAPHPVCRSPFEAGSLGGPTAVGVAGGPCAAQAPAGAGCAGGPTARCVSSACTEGGRGTHRATGPCCMHSAIVRVPLRAAVRSEGPHGARQARFVDWRSARLIRRARPWLRARRTPLMGRMWYLGAAGSKGCTCLYAARLLPAMCMSTYASGCAATRAASRWHVAARSLYVCV
jgi:hypothetical protein